MHGHIYAHGNIIAKSQQYSATVDIYLQLFGYIILDDHTGRIIQGTKERDRLITLMMIYFHAHTITRTNTCTACSASGWEFAIVSLPEIIGLHIIDYNEQPVG